MWLSKSCNARLPPLLEGGPPTGYGRAPFFWNFPVTSDSSVPSGHRAVFLDRDGVLNRAIVREGKPYPPQSLDEMEMLPGVPEALKTLREAGFRLIVVTNQPDVARGTQTRGAVDEIHDYMMRSLPLDDIRVCWDGDAKNSRCYKPQPGLLLDAAADHGIDLKRSFMVGDRWRDVGAGKAAGTFTIFLDYSYQEALKDTPDATVKSLGEAVKIILAKRAEQE
jgi:D-glycero-D-manno-heptose 1,7-bisphosphate phosphatase